MKAFNIATDFIYKRLVAVVYGPYEHSDPHAGVASDYGYVLYAPEKVLYNNAPFHTDEELLELLSGPTLLKKLLDKQGVVVQMFKMDTKYVERVG